jgi:hypothetical protein
MAPDMDQSFYLFTDACTTGVGAVLKQKHQDTLQPIGYFSKKLSPVLNWKRWLLSRLSNTSLPTYMDPNLLFSLITRHWSTYQQCETAIHV